MAEHRQHPDSTPRGRHAQRAINQPDERPARPVARQQAPERQSQPRRPQQAQQRPQQPASPTRQQMPRRQEPARPADPRQQAGVPAGAARPPRQAVPQGACPQQGPQGSRPVRQGARPQGQRPAQAGSVPPAAYGAAAVGGRGGKGGRREGAKKGGPWRVVFWVALVVFVAAVVALGAIAYSYWQGQNAYDAVAEEVFAPPADVEGAALADLVVDWDRLLAINPDTVGWIYIPGTVVNYPIVHTTNDEKYLTTDFNGQQTWGATYGSIFLSAANASDFSDANNIVYGHHLNNGSMFACVADFENAEAFEAHRTAYILTPQGNFKLRSLSLVHVAADDPLAQTKFASSEELALYIQDKIDRSVVAASDVPAAGDIAHLFSFATCDNLPSDGRFVLFSYLEESTVPGIEAVGGAAVVDPEAAAVVGDASKEVAA